MRCLGALVFTLCIYSSLAIQSHGQQHSLLEAPRGHAISSSTDAGAAAAAQLLQDSLALPAVFKPRTEAPAAPAPAPAVDAADQGETQAAAASTTGDAPAAAAAPDSTPAAEEEQPTVEVSLTLGAGPQLMGAGGTFDLLDSIIAEAARDVFGVQHRMPEPVHAFCKEMLLEPSMPRLLDLWDDGFELPPTPRFEMAAMPSFGWPSIPMPRLPAMPEAAVPLDGSVVVMSAHSKPGDPVQWEQVVVSSSGSSSSNSLGSGSSRTSGSSSLSGSDSGSDSSSSSPTLQEILSLIERDIAGSRIGRKLRASQPQLHSADVARLLIAAGRKLRAAAATL